MPALPRPPEAPITSTQSPDFSPAMSRSRLNATGAWRATTVATAKSTPSGIGCVHATGTFTYSAYPPQTCRPRMTGNEFGAGGRTNCRVTTRSPGLRAITPGPTAATTPDGSTPSTCGSWIGTEYAPDRTTRSSVRFTDTAWTSMSTSPACGAGVGTSSSRITSGGPNSRMTMAFMARYGMARSQRLNEAMPPYVSPMPNGTAAQSSGSTLTIRWSWLLPTQNVVGVVDLSTNTVRMLVSDGIRYCTAVPVLGSSRTTRSVCIVETQSSPFRSKLARYGYVRAGSSYSVNFSALVSNTATLLPRYSVTVMRS